MVDQPLLLFSEVFCLPKPFRGFLQLDLADKCPNNRRNCYAGPNYYHEEQYAPEIGPLNTCQHSCSLLGLFISETSEADYFTNQFVRRTSESLDRNGRTGYLTVNGCIEGETTLTGVESAISIRSVVLSRGEANRGISPTLQQTSPRACLHPSPSELKLWYPRLTSF